VSAAIRVAALLWVGLSGCVPLQPRVELSPARDGAPLIVVLTATAGWRHDSIPVARGALLDMARARGWGMLATERAEEMVAALPRARVLVFLLTSGDVLDEPAQGAVERFVVEGGSFAGVHSAADTEYGWPFYRQLVGAYFSSHPPFVQRAEVRVAGAAHEATRHLPDPWPWTDEWYNFRSLPLEPAEVLLRVDERSYSGGSMGADHPVAWTRQVGRGRSLYTALGHPPEAYRDPVFLRHLEGGLEWASR